MARIGLFVMVAFALLLSACATPPHAVVTKLTCPVTYWVRVDGYDVVAKDFKLNTTATWIGPDPDGQYVQNFDDEAALNAFDLEINNSLDRLNAGMKALYPNSGFLRAPQYESLAVSISTNHSSSNPSCSDYQSPFFAQPNQEYTALPQSNWDLGDYSTSTRIGGDTTYISVTSPMGSNVNYSFPTAYLDTVYAYAFDGGPALDLKSEIVVPSINPAGTDDYTQSVLQSLIQSDSNGREAVSFNLNVDDFEGRQELKPVIAKALELAASQENGPVMATMHAMTSHGQKTIASASAKGDSFHISGWQALTFGSIEGSGGGFDYQSSSSSWFEDLIKGSIYLTPAQ
jgi:hypothetical protein